MSEQPSVTFLLQDGQSQRTILDRLVAYIDGAQTSLDVAIYDAHLSKPYDDGLFAAFDRAERRGVEIRAVYNDLSLRPDGTPIVPKISKAMPQSGPSLLQRLARAVPFKGIPGDPDLMHHKYMIRDCKSVWTGSTNWTDDAWTKQENAIFTMPGSDISTAFQIDFDQLWDGGFVEDTGDLDDLPALLEYRGEPLSVRALFSPARGESISALIAKRITYAHSRISICSPVLTAAPILKALDERLDANDLPVDTIITVDGPQLRGALDQWRDNEHSVWKVPLLEQLLASGLVVEKPSTPYGPGRVHDYMHAKMVVCDDTVITGSFNCSRSGEMNAENVLEIISAPMADECDAFARKVHAIYARS